MTTFEERIADFVRETGADVPNVTHLAEAACDELRERLSQALNIPRATGFQIAEVLRLREAVLPPPGISDDDFCFGEVLRGNGIHTGPHVYINWAAFNVIDRFETSFIKRYIQDLLYPDGDYIDVFDDGMQWVISIDYESRLRLLRL